MKKARKIFLIAILSIAGLCLLLVGGLAVSNAAFPRQSLVVDVLSDADLVRLGEFYHLRQALGDEVWPGWGQADIPAILYNEAYVFLVGHAGEPAAGWVKVPAGIQRGGAWELAPEVDLAGQPYYRWSLEDPQVTPQAFTVKVGDRWVSSISTYEWTKIGLAVEIRQGLPPFLQPIFPYRIFLGQLVSGDDQYISLIAHEAFHAYQGMAARERLAASENMNSRFADRYPWGDETFQARWHAELDTLAQALQVADQAAAADLARRFLAGRAERREAIHLGGDLVEYEQQREWLEGLARYAELEIWRLAARGRYTPRAETTRLREFDGYRGFDIRWSREIDQIGRMAGDEGDGRFYYSGMAQAVLLDRLMPGWKARAFDEGVWLEDLLAETLDNP